MIKPARERAVECLRERFQREPAIVVRAPGRINLLGGHVDHSEGFVLPVATDRSVWLALTPNQERRVRVVALDVGDAATFALDAVAHSRPEGWVAYPQGVAWALQDAGYELSGFDATLCSDVPIGTGLSSSAALEVAFALGWATLNELDIEKTRLALLCQRAENEYVGVACGIMDQLTSLKARQGHVMYLDCRTLDTQDVPLPDEVAIVICDTGVRRELSDSSYNDRRAQVEEAVRLLRPLFPEITTLREVSVAELGRLEALPEPLRRRARHVVTEIARVLDGVDALHAADLKAFGAAVSDSHRSSRDDYESTINELDVLAEAAWAVEGCYGARLSGGGFGGCTLSLVQADSVETFTARVSAAYAEAVGREPAITICQAGSGAEVF